MLVLLLVTLTVLLHVGTHIMQEGFSLIFFQNCADFVHVTASSHITLLNVTHPHVPKFLLCLKKVSVHFDVTLGSGTKQTPLILYNQVKLVL